ncbi:2-keto-3-deoxygluconate permease [Cytobacillus purgationiresistens]|uniref:2-keto-3-deoxygluconate permease n=2 Tax=Cytobacillus purgationiresistens TaxID=863449 RepID=A0ABU0ABB5_9BACI|nr:2-keto-3-deoxygluconate permease [Cytobacillus purgationiresistens]
MMRIKAGIEKIPGGMMVVPLFLGALLNTLAPDTATYFGGFTGAMLTGTSAILAVFFFCVGATIDVKQSGYIAKKGMTLLVGKVVFAALLGYGAALFLPADGIQSGLFAGLSVLVIIAAFNETNGGLYTALMTKLGRTEDAAAFPFISIESGPFFTMIILGVGGLATFPWQTIVSTLIPFAVGMIIGNIDKEMRSFLGQAVPVLIPFFALALGFGLDFGMIVRSGFMGILMGVAVVFLSGGVLYLMDRYITGSDGVAGVAASSTAGAAVAVPFIIAELNPQFAPVAESATAIIATSVLVTALLTPVLTMWIAKVQIKRGIPQRKIQKGSSINHSDQAKITS